MGKSDVELSLFLRDMAKHAAAMVKSVAAAATAGTASGGEGSGSGSGGGSGRRGGSGSSGTNTRAPTLAPALASNAPAAAAAVTATSGGIVRAAGVGSAGVATRGSQSDEMGGAANNAAGHGHPDGTLQVAVPSHHGASTVAVIAKSEPQEVDALHLPGPGAHSTVPAVAHSVQETSIPGFHASFDADTAAGQVFVVSNVLSSRDSNLATLEGSGGADEGASTDVAGPSHTATKECKPEWV